MSSATLPPPLSDTPTVETLERLLAGLHQPVQRGVPSPPDASGALDAAMFGPATAISDGEAVVPSQVAPAPAQAPAPAPVAPVVSAPAPAAAPDRSGPTSLSWSAAHARRGRLSPTAIGVAVVTAAGVVAGLVATGELPLP